MMTDNPNDDMEGVEPTEPEEQTTPLLSAEELRVLEVYDRLEELQLEIAALKAQGVLSQDGPADASEEDIEQAQSELLKARATYQIRNNVVEQTLIANPILNAVHSGSNASAVEQDLLPLLHKRDALSFTLAQLNTNLLLVNNELKQVESEHIATSRRNTELSQEMIALAEEASNQRREDLNDPEVRQQLDDLEADLKASRQRWRIMKATTSAVVVGSGVDWARDPRLLEIVLDKEGEED